MNIQSLKETLWNRRWVVAAVVVVELAMSPFLVGLTRPTYEATADVAYVSPGQTSLLPPSDLPTLVMSQAVMERVRNELNLPGTIDDIRMGTKTKVTPRSNVLPITFHSRNPQRALMLANTIADVTVSEYKNLSVRQYDDVIFSIQKQLADQQGRIRSYDAQLQNAVQHDPFVGSAQSLETIANRLDDLQSQHSQAYATFVADQGAAETLAGGAAGPTASGLASVVREQALASDPVFQAVRNGQSKDVAEYQAEKAGYTDAFPGLAGLKEKVTRETEQVDRTAQKSAIAHRGASITYASLLMSQRTAQSLVAGDKARVAAIDREIANTRQRLVNLPRYGVAANQLRLQRDSAAGSFALLQNRLQTTIADKAQAGALGSLVVLDHATAALPKFPRVVLSFLIAALILGLALGSAFAAEALDPRIRTATDVETLYGSPHIGSI